MDYKKYSSLRDINKKQFQELVKSGFGKDLIQGYFEYVNPKYICLAETNESYLGGIVVESMGEDIYYLDKIVVAKDCQNQKIGSNLWKILNGDIKKLVWRARKENPIINFYTEQCEGMQKVDDWVIFWKGLNPDELKKGIKYAKGKKVTLKELR